MTGTTFAGKSDWRVPNIRELLTIVDRSVRNPAIDPLAFPGASSSVFWSSTGSWYVDFVSGKASSAGAPVLGSARLVRAGQSVNLLDVARPDSDYVDHGDGTVTHTPTKLMWQRCAVGQTLGAGGICTGNASSYDWSTATQLSSSLKGYTDWRLPTEDELLSLVDYTSVPTINTRVFPSVPTDPRFWSASAITIVSTLYANSYYWFINFGNGSSLYADINLNTNTTPIPILRARLVRVDTSVTTNTTTAAPTTTTVAPTTTTAAPTTTTAAPTTTTTSTVATTTTTTVPVTTTTTTSTTSTTTRTTTTTTSTTQAAPSGWSILDSSTPGTPGTSLELTAGWNLLGNGWNLSLPVASIFGDAARVITVWKWDVAKSGWQFYSPSMTASDLQTYAAGKGFGALSTVGAGEGFWVNVKKPFTLGLPIDGMVTGVDFQSGGSRALATGWNLIAVGESLKASGFNNALSTTPPVAGTVPQNLTTLWAWDNPQTKWYFYSPQLDNKGGTALTDYITGKGYLDFTATHRLLDAGTGFWVNKP